MNFRGTCQQFLFVILAFLINFKCFSQDLVPLQDRKSNLFGYISNKNPNWIIKPSYHFATEFNHGSAVVGMDGKFGLIDSKGKFIAPPVYEYLFGSKFMTFKIGDTIGLMNSKGEILLSDNYSHLYYDEEHGNAILRKGDLYGYWDTTGILIAPFSIYEIMFEDGVSYFNTGKSKGFIDMKGKKLVETESDLLDRIGGKGFIFKSSDPQNDSVTYFNSAGEKIKTFKSIVQITDSLIIYKENNKFGIVNHHGEERLPLEYDYISGFNSNGYSILSKNGLYGVMDNSLSLVLPIDYEYIDAYGDSAIRNFEFINNERALTLIWKDSLCGLINDSAKIIIEPKYKEATRHDDLFLYKEDSLLTVMSLENGYFYDIKDVFHNSLGKAVYPETKRKSSMVGLVDISGKVILPAKYKKITPLYNTLFIIDNGNGVGLVDTSGVFKVPCSFSSIYILNDIIPSRDPENILFDNYLYVISAGGKFGVLDRNGKIVIDTGWNNISVFDDDGQCFFGQDKKNKWKIIHSDGSIKSLKLDEPAIFNSKIAIAKSRNKKGVIHSSGKTMIPFKYNKVLIQPSIGYLVQQKDSLWGLLSEEGKPLIKPQFRYVSDFVGEFAFAKKKTWGVVDKKGVYSEGYKRIDSIHHELSTRKNVSTFSFSSTNNYDEITLDLLNDSTLKIASIINNFILDSLKSDLITCTRLIPDKVKQESVVNESKVYKGRGIEILNATNTTATLNFYEESSINGVNLVKENCRVYCWDNSMLKEVRLNELFQDPEYAAFLNEIIASKLREADSRIIPSQGNLVFFNPDKFQIAAQGLILKINERGLNYSNEGDNEVLISYHDIEGIAKKDGVLKKFYK